MRIEFDGGDIEVKHMYKSGCEQLFGFDDVYHMVLDSKIGIKCGEPDPKIIVSGEMVHFELGYVYDKFFFYGQNCRIISEDSSVSNMIGLLEIADKKKKKESRFDRITDFLFSGAFGGSTALFILFKLIFGANDWPLPLWTIILFWILGYSIQWIAEKAFSKCITKKRSKLTELDKYTSKEYVISYFQNSSREWVGNDRVDL